MAKIFDLPGAVAMATVYRCFRCQRSFKVPYGQPPEGLRFYTLKPPEVPPVAPELSETSGALCPGCVMKAAEFLKLDVTAPEGSS